MRKCLRLLGKFTWCDNINLLISSGCNTAVTMYIIAMDTKNRPVGVKNVPCTTMSPKGRFVMNMHSFSNIVKKMHWVVLTNDGKKGRSHEECVKNTHDGSNSYLGVRFSYETDDDVENRRNACDDDGKGASHLKDKLKSSWLEIS